MTRATMVILVILIMVMLAPTSADACIGCGCRGNGDGAQVCAFDGGKSWKLVHYTYDDQYGTWDRTGSVWVYKPRPGRCVRVGLGRGFGAIVYNKLCPSIYVVR